MASVDMSSMIANVLDEQKKRKQFANASPANLKDAIAPTDPLDPANVIGMRLQQQQAPAAPAAGAATHPAEELAAKAAKLKPKEQAAGQKVIAEVGRNIASVPEEQKPAAIWDEIKRIREEMANPKQKQYTKGEKIATGLLMTLPTLIGLGVGGLEGGAVGADTSLKAMQSMTDSQKAEQARQDGLLKDQVNGLERRALKQDDITADNSKLDKTLGAQAREGSLNRANDLEKAKIAATQRDTNKMTSLETNLRKELADSDEFKLVSKVNSYASNLENSRKNHTAFGDLATVYDFMKVLDPTSVVRESEGKLFLETSSLPSTLKNSLQKLVNGERINDDQYKQIQQVVASRKANAESAYQRRSQSVLAQSNKLGLDSNIVNPYVSTGGAPSQRPMPTPEQAAAELARRRATK